MHTYSMTMPSTKILIQSHVYDYTYKAYIIIHIYVKHFNCIKCIIHIYYQVGQKTENERNETKTGWYGYVKSVFSLDLKRNLFLTRHEILYGYCVHYYNNKKSVFLRVSYNGIGGAKRTLSYIGRVLVFVHI